MVRGMSRDRNEEQLNALSKEQQQANALIAQKNSELDALATKLSKYLSPQIYHSIFTGAQTVEVAAQRKKLTIFFSDIADFTATADMLESEELTTLLNQYLTEMSAIALEYGATIGSLDSVEQDPAATTEHEITLSALDPDTTYYYAIGDSTELLVGDDGRHFFITHPVPGTVEPTRIWVLGDSGSWVAGLPFFMVIALASFISLLARHLTQYACIQPPPFFY